MPGEAVEVVPGEGSGEQLAADAEGGAVPDAAERVPSAPGGIPGFQDGVEEEDARHGQVGQLETHAADDGRVQHQLHQKGQAKHAAALSGPMQNPQQLPDQDEQIGPHDGRGGSRHEREEAAAQAEEHQAEDAGGPGIPPGAHQFVKKKVDDAHVQAGKGQQVGGSAGTEKADGFRRQAASVGRQEGPQQGRGGVGGEGEGVDAGAEGIGRSGGEDLQGRRGLHHGDGPEDGAEKAQQQKAEQDDADGGFVGHQAEPVPQQDRKGEEGEQAGSQRPRGTGGNGRSGEDARRENHGQGFYAFRSGHTCEISNNFVSL